jgi:hypothetical protein
MDANFDLEVAREVQRRLEVELTVARARIVELEAAVLALMIEPSELNHPADIDVEESHGFVCNHCGECGVGAESIPHQPGCGYRLARRALDKATT